MVHGVNGPARLGVVQVRQHLVLNPGAVGCPARPVPGLILLDPSLPDAAPQVEDLDQGVPEAPADEAVDHEVYAGVQDEAEVVEAGQDPDDHRTGEAVQGPTVLVMLSPWKRKFHLIKLCLFVQLSRKLQSKPY